MTLTSVEVVAGPAAGRWLNVDEPLLIGREAVGGGDLGGDPELSRRHARISLGEDGRLLVEDLGSTNGTLVNGVPVSKVTVVNVGDAVAVGTSVLRVVTAKESPPVGASGAGRSPKGLEAPEHEADLAIGGVHAVPTDLLSVLVARAPVPREWIVRAALSIFPVILALNLTIRTAAEEYFNVSTNLTVMHLHTIIIITVLQIVGNSVSFYGNFGRPAGHSPLRWLSIGLLVVLVLLTLTLSSLPSNADAGDYVVTILIVIMGPAIIYPIMLGLRLRAQLAAGQRLRVHETMR